MTNKIFTAKFERVVESEEFDIFELSTIAAGTNIVVTLDLIKKEETEFVIIYDHKAEGHNTEHYEYKFTTIIEAMIRLNDFVSSLTHEGFRC